MLSQLPPEVVSRPSTPQGPVNPNNLNKTLGNVAEVQAMFQRTKNGDLSDTDTLIVLEKLGKAAANTVAEKTLTRAVNQDLVDATKKREKRKHQNREDGADGSYARVMGREELLRRREWRKGLRQLGRIFLTQALHWSSRVILLQKTKARNLDLLQSLLQSLLQEQLENQLQNPNYHFLHFPI